MNWEEWGSENPSLTLQILGSLTKPPNIAMHSKGGAIGLKSENP